MNLETEDLKRRLIETQMALLQYQHRDVLANIEALTPMPVPVPMPPADQAPGSADAGQMPVKTYGANALSG